MRLIKLPLSFFIFTINSRVAPEWCSEKVQVVVPSHDSEGGESRQYPNSSRSPKFSLLDPPCHKVARSRCFIHYRTTELPKCETLEISSFSLIAVVMHLAPSVIIPRRHFFKRVDSSTSCLVHANLDTITRNQRNSHSILHLWIGQSAVNPVEVL